MADATPSWLTDIRQYWTQYVAQVQARNLAEGPVEPDDSKVAPSPMPDYRPMLPSPEFRPLLPEFVTGTAVEAHNPDARPTKE
jgi:hypothetical protein